MFCLNVLMNRNTRGVQLKYVTVKRDEHARAWCTLDATSNSARIDPGITKCYIKHYDIIEETFSLYKIAQLHSRSFQ